VKKTVLSRVPIAKFHVYQKDELILCDTGMHDKKTGHQQVFQNAK